MKKLRLLDALCVCVFTFGIYTFASANTLDTVATFHLSGTVDVYNGEQFDFGVYNISTSSVQSLISSLEALSSCDIFTCPLGGAAIHQLTWEANFPFEVTLATGSLIPYSNFAPNAQFINPDTNDILIINGGTYTGTMSIIVDASTGVGLPIFQACIDSSCAEYLPSVPIPTSVWLFVSGLIGLIGVARRNKA